MNIFEDLRQKIEWQILQIIKGLTDVGKMTQEQAQAMAKHVLDCLQPNMTPQDFFKGVFKIDDGFPELAFIVVPIARMYKQQIEDKTKERVTNLVHTAHYDEAVNLAKKLVSYDINVKIVAQAGKK